MAPPALHVPAPQLVQLEAPSSEAYSPLSQSMHAEEPAAEYVPARQLSHSEAPSAVHVPAGQSEHEVLAEAPLYVPAGHRDALAWPVADA